MKPIREDSVWDKKKIFIFSTVLLVVLLFLSYRFIDFNSNEGNIEPPSTTVKGVSAQDLSENIVQSIENLQNQATDLDIEEVATSSPQVQKILNDLKSLKDVPKNQIKNTCEQICSGL